MGKLRWYKRDPQAALDGMLHMTLEETGAYNKVLDLIYLRDGAVPDDAAFLCRWLNCDVRVWKRLRQRLIDLGKLYVDGAQLRNKRADSEVDEGLAILQLRAYAGRSSARKRASVSNENNDLAPTHEGHTYIYTNISSTDVDESPLSPPVPAAKPKRQKPDYGRGFDEVWAVYPCRAQDGKAGCAKLYAAAVKAGADPQAILAGAQRWAAVVDPKDEYRIGLCRWLKDGLWPNAPPSPRKSTVTSLTAIRDENIRGYREDGTTMFDEDEFGDTELQSRALPGDADPTPAGRGLGPAFGRRHSRAGQALFGGDDEIFAPSRAVSLHGMGHKPH
jgi:hypothetical protein